MNKILFDTFNREVFLQKKNLYVLSQSRKCFRDWAFDVRSFVLNAKNAELIFLSFWKKCGDQYPFQIAGETLAGAMLAQLLSLKAREKKIALNAFAIREERKEKGVYKNIEGEVKDLPVIIVDDIFNSGGTITYALELFKQKGIHPLGVYAYIDYENKEGKEFLKNHDLKLFSEFELSKFVASSSLEFEWESACLDINLQWEFHSPNPNTYIVPKSSPVEQDGKLFFGADNGYVYCLDSQTGDEVWSFKTGEHILGKGIFSTPIVVNNLMYIGSYDGNLYALNKDTGEQVWIYAEADWIGSSPCIDVERGIIFIGLEFSLEGQKGGIAALNALSGERLWIDYFDDYVHCSPACADGVVVIGSNCGYVRGYELNTGKRLWEKNIGQPVKASFCFDDDTVYFGAFDNKLYALDYKSGVEKFSAISEGLIYSTPVMSDDLVYVTSTDKTLYGIDRKSGGGVNSFMTLGKIFSTPVVWEDFIVFGSNDGRLYFINFKKQQEFYLQFTERITTKVCFSKNSLYVYLLNNEIHTYSLKELREKING